MIYENSILLLDTLLNQTKPFNRQKTIMMCNSRDNTHKNWDLYFHCGPLLLLR